MMDIEDVIGGISLDGIHREGIRFTAESLAYTLSILQGSAHITAYEFAEGFAAYAKEAFGGLALFVLNTWGLHTTADIGRCVFALIDTGFFMRSEGDNRSDFEGLYNFEEKFNMDAIIREKCLPITS